MKTIIRNFLAIAILLILGGRAAQAQQILYGLGLAPNTGEPTTFTFDLTTGEGTAVGALGDSAALIYGLAGRPDGTLYTFDANAHRIRQIDPTTGAFIGTPVDIGVGNVSGEGDLTFSLDGNTGYLTTAFRPGQSVTGISPGLYVFTLAGSSTFVGTTADSLGPVTVDGMAFSPTNGLLYALTDADTRLYTLNPQTGVLTPVGELGVTPQSGYGTLAFESNGTLFGVIDNRLYSISTVTGAATIIGNGFGTDFGSVSGAAFRTTPASPTPPTGVDNSAYWRSFADYYRTVGNSYYAYFASSDIYMALAYLEYYYGLSNFFLYRSFGDDASAVYAYYAGVAGYNFWAVFKSNPTQAFKAYYASIAFGYYYYYALNGSTAVGISYYNYFSALAY